MVRFPSCEYYKHVTFIIWTQVMPFLYSFGDMKALIVYWTFYPYAGLRHLCGAYWGHLGVVCWKHLSILLT